MQGTMRILLILQMENLFHLLRLEMAKKELFIMDTNGDNIRKVLSLDGNILFATWSPLYEN